MTIVVIVKMLFAFDEGVSERSSRSEPCTVFKDKSSRWERMSAFRELVSNRLAVSGGNVISEEREVLTALIFRADNVISGG